MADKAIMYKSCRGALRPCLLIFMPPIAVAAALFDCLPHAPLAMLPEAGHALPFEKPRQLAALMRNVITTHHLSESTLQQSS